VIEQTTTNTRNSNLTIPGHSHIFIIIIVGGGRSIERVEGHTFGRDESEPGEPPASSGIVGHDGGNLLHVYMSLWTCHIMILKKGLRELSIFTVYTDRTVQVQTDYKRAAGVDGARLV